MRNKIYLQLMIVGLLAITVACKSSKIVIRDQKANVPSNFRDSTVQDSTNTANTSWKAVFSDKNLVALIDSALVNNQELNSMGSEVLAKQYEVRAKKGEILPVAGLKLGGGVEKVGEFTRDGAVESQLEIEHGKAFPEPLGDVMIGAFFSWEIDIWKKLRNSKKAAASRYMATVEGQNFLKTGLVAEIANSYYELLAMDNQLEIVSKAIAIQTDVLGVIKQQKEAARVTQLAVNRFEAQLLHTKNLQYELKQSIVETENRINFLVGRYPQTIQRDFSTFNEQVLDSIFIGQPNQLLANRPDIRQAELELAATKLDVKAARANFYPTLSLDANVGFQAFNPKVWFNPASLLYNVFGDLMAPLINRNAVKAVYGQASAKQLQAVIDYERTILEAYTEVVNQMKGIENYSLSYQTKSREVELLEESVMISKNLFQSARADYMEVLLTQRESIESKMELIEIKLKQLSAQINLYKALGGGWK